LPKNKFISSVTSSETLDTHFQSLYWKTFTCSRWHYRMLNLEHCKCKFGVFLAISSKSRKFLHAPCRCWFSEHLQVERLEMFTKLESGLNNNLQTSFTSKFNKLCTQRNDPHSYITEWISKLSEEDIIAHVNNTSVARSPRLYCWTDSVWLTVRRQGCHFDRTCVLAPGNSNTARWRPIPSQLILATIHTCNQLFTRTICSVSVDKCRYWTYVIFNAWHTLLTVFQTDDGKDLFSFTTLSGNHYHTACLVP